MGRAEPRGGWIDSLLAAGIFLARRAHFCGEIEEIVIVCIDVKKLRSEVRYEDADGCGRKYPHIYGLVNRDAVTMVLPFLRDADGHYVKNQELAEFADQ